MFYYKKNLFQMGPTIRYKVLCSEIFYGVVFQASAIKAFLMDTLFRSRQLESELLLICSP